MPESPTAALLVDINECTATVTLNRPGARNALSTALRRELRSTIRALDADPHVRAIVLTGVDPAFCAGVDLRELQETEPAEDLVPLDAPFATTSTPLIGAVNGAAYTGGLELALACHVLIASERATFADTHARLGLTPGWGMTVLLPEAIGMRRARQMMVTCRPIDAQTALDWALVNEVVPHTHVLSRALEVAHAITECDAAAVGRITTTLNEQASHHQAHAWTLEARAFLGADLSGRR